MNEEFLFETDSFQVLPLYSMRSEVVSFKENDYKNCNAIKQCNNKLIRNIKDNKHHITKNLIRNVRSKQLRLVIEQTLLKLRHIVIAFYKNIWGYIRDGTPNLYKIVSRTNKNQNKPKSSLENLKMSLKVIMCNEKPFLKCLFCGELKKALKTNQTLSRLCFSQQKES